MKEETSTKIAKVNPFRGVRYGKNSTKDVMSLLAPPYDVISPEKQDRLYNANDKNVVRLILGKINETDTDADNRYTRSAACLSQWMADETLAQDDVPALYLYAQTYEIDGKKLKRVGFICRRLIEEFGESVFPHERTLSGPKTDRLNLTRACRMNFSPVFGLYSDPDLTLDKIWNKIMENEPAEFCVTDEDNVTHCMWVVTDPSAIATAQELLEKIPMIIADGHHRYETALNYRNERRAQDGAEAPQEYDYALVFLSNTHGEGFTVLPTHRVVVMSVTPTSDEIMNRLATHFTITTTPVERDMHGFVEKLAQAGHNNPSFGMYMGGGNIHLLELQTEKYLTETDGKYSPEPLRRLDVTILQDLIFEKILGVCKETVADKKSVSYTIDAAEAVKLVDSGAAKMTFIMNPTDVDQVIAIATAGGIMPQKSTYFYPKLITGLVFNPLG